MMISTNLKGDLCKTILESVIVQMADGIWENSDEMWHYWPYVDIKDINGDIYIHIKEDGEYTYGMVNDGVDNWFIRQDKLDGRIERIRDFFAWRLRDIVMEYSKDNPGEHVRFYKDCNAVVGYIDDNVRACDAYDVFVTLMGN